MLLLLTLTTTNRPYTEPLIIYSSSKHILHKMVYENNMKNNNPFNIRQNNNNHWVGKVESNTNHNGFEQFISMKYGIRAGLKLLINYYNNYELNTIDKIITKFAPPTENDTEGYIKFVCAKTGYAHDQVIDLNNKTTLLSVAKAILKMESNMNATNDQLNAAFNLLYQP